MGGHREDKNKLFLEVHIDRTSRVATREILISDQKKFFTMRVIRCPREVVESPSLEILRTCLDNGLSNLI